MSRRVPPRDPMRSSATDNGPTDARDGAWVGARERWRTHQARTRIQAEVDLGEPDRPVVTIAFLVAALALTCWEFSTYGASPTVLELVEAGGASLGALADGGWWKFLTANFLHGGLLHLAMNVFVIYLTGRWLEHLVGRVVVLATVLWSCVLASAGALLVGTADVTIGASGVAFGLVGCAIAADPRARTATGVVARQLGIVNVIGTFLVPGISIGGHLGGLAAGLLVGLVARSRRPSADAAVGRTRNAPALALLILSTVPIVGLALGPDRLPWGFEEPRSTIVAPLLARQMSGATLGNGERLDDASCEPTGDPLEYRCDIDGSERTAVFDPDDDQWAVQVDPG